MGDKTKMLKFLFNRR